MYGRNYYEEVATQGSRLIENGKALFNSGCERFNLPPSIVRNVLAGAYITYQIAQGVGAVAYVACQQDLAARRQDQVEVFLHRREPTYERIVQDYAAKLRSLDRLAD